MKRSSLNALVEARKNRRALVLVTPFGKDGEEIIYEDAFDPAHPLADAVQSCFRTGRSMTLEGDDGEVFLQAFLPEPRLMIIGATHIGQVLVSLAREVGMTPLIIDPRTAFATEDRFRDVELIAKWPGEAFDEIGLDRRCAVVCLAHVPEIDDEALIAALNSDCFYIGALGSSRSHAKRIERLTDKGADKKAMERIHGPVGLDIGSVTPAEIALSIAAEAVQALRKGDAQAS